MLYGIILENFNIVCKTIFNCLGISGLVSNPLWILIDSAQFWITRIIFYGNLGAFAKELCWGQIFWLKFNFLDKIISLMQVPCLFSIVPSFPLFCWFVLHHSSVSSTVILYPSFSSRNYSYCKISAAAPKQQCLWYARIKQWPTIHPFFPFRFYFLEILSLTLEAPVSLHVSHVYFLFFF